MADQAQGLRELVAGDAAYRTYTGKLGRVESNHPAPLLFTPDKAKLWDELKAELEVLARGRNLAGNMPGQQAFGATNESHHATWALDRMNQAEIFATHVLPANPQDFANVRTELKGEPHEKV